MSRIGVTPITIPNGVTVSIQSSSVSVKGKNGELKIDVPRGIKVAQQDDAVTITRQNNQRQTRAYHGMVRSLIANMVTGVTDGYTKKLELVGTGYRAKKQGNNIVLNVGYSQPVEFPIPEGISIELEGETIVSVSGIDKQIVGHTAAEIRKIRPPEPYKGKGIRYQGELIRRKAGKATKVGAAA